MAYMIPNEPRSAKPESLEGLIFESLKHGLPPEYIVVHSYKLLDIDEQIHERETDFIIFHKEKGIICVEAKAGKIYYEDGKWYYANGDAMKRDGPYNQASTFKHDFISYLVKNGFAKLLSKCKFLHAVWFPSVPEVNVQGKLLPSEADIRVTLFKGDLNNPQKKIDEIFGYECDRKGLQTNISQSEANDFIENVLCPYLKLEATGSMTQDYENVVFHRLQKEQEIVLDFLTEQKTAIINGAAGTGKTMVAVAKAKRNARNGEKVLFLCYNRMLRDHLEKTYSNPLIDFYNIDLLATDVLKSATFDYDRLGVYYIEQLENGEFPYKHVIVDEGQDFGQDRIEETDIINILESCVTDKSVDGTFYVFYDKLQIVHKQRDGHKLPDYIADADCKITLYKNCRNTKEVAETSLRPVTDRSPILKDDGLQGEKPRLFIRKPEVGIDVYLDSIIEKLKDENIENIEILTCWKEKTSEVYQYCTEVKEREYKYKNSIPFTTCRRFKGLEADAIILVDVNRAVFDGSNVNLFYAGASRARLKLFVIADVSEDECSEIAKILTGKTNVRRPYREFASALNSLNSVLTEE